MKNKCDGFRICLEQKEGKGEDSAPILEIFSKQLAGFIGVFDGMGGAGAATYDYHGAERTGAYIASNFIRNVVCKFFRGLLLYQPNSPIEMVAGSLKLNLQTNLKRLSDEYGNESRSKLKSSLIKQFPTTMAVIYFKPSRGFVPGRIIYNCKSFWAGDSRCFLLTEFNGLQQISEDDVKSGGDALENLTNDSPLSNCISAGADFSVKFFPVDVESPVIFIVATDGCFAYVPTPAHFEYILLETLNQANSFKEWEKQLIYKFEQISGDDASMSLVCLGWEDYEELKRSFEARHKFLREEYILPIDDLNYQIRTYDDQIKEANLQKQNLISERNELRHKLWLEYKKKYEIATPQEENCEERFSN